MKTFIGFLFLFMLSHNLYASTDTDLDCMDGINIYPTGEMIYQNSLIVLSNWGSGNTQSILMNLEVEYFAYLISADHEVKLNLEELRKTKERYFQAILRPDEELRPGRVYKIFIKNLNEAEQNRYFKKRNNKTYELEDIDWIVLYGNDLQSPTIQEEPELVEKTCKYYGCGAEKYAVFEYKIKDKSDVMVFAEVKEVETNITTSFFADISNENKIYIGRWMCGGPIDYRNGKNYEIKFKVFDMSGNTSGRWSKTINYEHPCERCDY
ncbi:MAG: hypothetical protein AB8F74_05625 [Saprospiraceae bacterium]